MTVSDLDLLCDDELIEHPKVRHQPRQRPHG